jgi:hypothetical protein
MNIACKFPDSRQIFVDRVLTGSPWLSVFLVEIWKQNEGKLGARPAPILLSFQENELLYNRLDFF